MTFIPSRDLVHLYSRKTDVGDIIAKVNKGLDDLARALGTAEDEEEHNYISKDGVRMTNPVGGQDEPSKEENEEDGREEAFELNFARDWLMNVSCLRWLPLSNDDTQEEQEAIDEILRRAARLVAICAGKSASGRSRIVYHFKCGEQGNTEFNVKIHEEVLVEDSLGSRTWGSAPILVSQLLQGPLTSSFAEQDVENDLRILELGSGTGLLGLAISKYIESQTERRAQIYLTDYHPDVLLNLRKNADLNDSGTEEQRVEVKVARLDWTESKSDRVTGQFDLIVAADCIYEADHATLVKGMAERYLHQPRQDPKTKPQLILCCALRPTHQIEIQHLEQAFSEQNFTSSSLQITHQQDITGWDDFGPPSLHLGPIKQRAQRGQQTFYRLYTIQWC